MTHNNQDYILNELKKNAFLLNTRYRLHSSNYTLMLKALRENNDIIKFVSPSLRSNKRFMLEAVKLHYTNVVYACNFLKGDQEIFWHVLEKDGDMLRYARNSVKNNLLLVLLAVKNSPKSIRFSSLHLRFLCTNKEPYSALLKEYREKFSLDLSLELQSKKINRNNIIKL